MTRGHVLITRPEEDSADIVALVKAKGFEASAEPFMKLVFYQFDLDDHDNSLPKLEKYGALVFTSANAVRAYCLQYQERDLPVFTVGKSTALVARQEGFKKVTSGDRDVVALKQILADERSDKPYLYIRGEHVSHPITLPEGSVRVKEKILYNTEKVKKISPDCTDLLQRRKITHILFFSRRTAESFVDYIRTQGLENSLKRTKALCLGPSMVECLSVLPWQNVESATRPTREGIMDLLEEA